MAYGDPNDFGWWNLVVKFLLFVTNIIVWLLGVALLGAGVYVLRAPETNLDNLDVDNFLTAPAILLCIIGGLLFILGFCGCFGALLELYVPLLVYTGVLTCLVVAEIVVVVYVYLRQDSAYTALESTLNEAIVEYYDDPDKASIIDNVQSELFQCCGVNGPEDWTANPYFNCSSQTFQRCSVPYSCCVLEENEVVNVQCGIQALNATSEYYYRLADSDIHSEGCLDAVRNVFQQNLSVILGFGIGLLVFQLFNIMLAGGLALDIRKEKAAMKLVKQRKTALEQPPKY